MGESTSTLPKTTGVVLRGIEQGLHTGVQLCVILDGTTIFDGGIGRAGVMHDLTADTIMPWRSAGKPLTAVLVLRAFEQGEVSIDDRVVRFLPEFAAGGKKDVTVRHLLTHTSGFAKVNTGWPQLTWDQSLGKIHNAKTDAGAIPGKTAAYHPQSSWFVLGEILRCIDGSGVEFEQLMQTELLRPLSLTSCWCGVPDEVAAERAMSLPEIDERVRGASQHSPLTSGLWLSRCSPGGNLRGPVSQLAAFYEMLLNDGVTRNGRQFLRPSSIAKMVVRHREGQFDHTFRHQIDFGLGVIPNSSRYGTETVPYGYGTHRSAATFGHGGAQCSIAFCDPSVRLVVAWAANGLPGEPRHQIRNREINDAISADMEL